MMIHIPFDRQSVSDAVIIVGPSIVNLQGKTTRNTQDHARIGKINSITLYSLSRHKNIILGIDVVKINSVIVLVTYLSDIKFATATQSEDAKMPTIIKYWQPLKSKYSIREFLSPL